MTIGKMSHELCAGRLQRPRRREVLESGSPRKIESRNWTPDHTAIASILELRFNVTE